jgi:uncharacterized protein YdeI (YjbR/CyaY-like superfamily)
MQRSASAEEFISKHPQWEDLLIALRRTLLSTGLEETIKWGVPVYTLGGKNIVGLTAFRKFSALWFFQGALLRDEAGILINAQEGKTRAQRQWRFESIGEFDEQQVLAYVREAIENQRQGKAVKPAPRKAISIPEELTRVLRENPELGQQFAALAPYKQREYAEYISQARRADTRVRRLEKITPMIGAGKGLNDRYR